MPLESLSSTSHYTIQPLTASQPALGPGCIYQHHQGTAVISLRGTFLEQNNGHGVVNFPPLGAVRLTPDAEGRRIGMATPPKIGKPVLVEADRNSGIVATADGLQLDFDAYFNTAHGRAKFGNNASLAAFIRAYATVPAQAAPATATAIPTATASTEQLLLRQFTHMPASILLDPPNGSPRALVLPTNMRTVGENAPVLTPELRSRLIRLFSNPNGSFQNTDVGIVKGVPAALVEYHIPNWSPQDAATRVTLTLDRNAHVTNAAIQFPVPGEPPLLLAFDDIEPTAPATTASSQAKPAFPPTTLAQAEIHWLTGDLFGPLLKNKPHVVNHLSTHMLTDSEAIGTESNGKPYVKFEGDILPPGHSAASSPPGTHRWFLQVHYRLHKGSWQIEAVSKQGPDDHGTLTLRRARDNDGAPWKMRKQLVSLGSTTTSSSASTLGRRSGRSVSPPSEDARPTSRVRTQETGLERLHIGIPETSPGSAGLPHDTSRVPSTSTQTTTANFLHGGTSLAGCAVPLPSNDTVLTNLKYDLKNAVWKVAPQAKSAVNHAVQFVQNLGDRSIATMVRDNTLTNAAETYLLQYAGEQAQRPRANRNSHYFNAERDLGIAITRICLNISFDHGVNTPTAVEFAKIPAGRANSELVRSVSAELCKVSLRRKALYIRTIEEFVSSLKGKPLHWIAAHNELSAYVSNFKIANPELSQSFTALDRYLPRLLRKTELGVSTEALASGITRKEYRLEDHYNFDQLNDGELAPIPSTIPKGRSNSELISGFIAELRRNSNDSSNVKCTIEFAETMLDGASLNALHQTGSLEALVKLFIEENRQTVSAPSLERIETLLDKRLPRFLERLSEDNVPS